MVLAVFPTPTVTLPRLQKALKASWCQQTAYCGVFEVGNPALGQCYPTSRVVQWFFPTFDIVMGEVDTGTAIETHFWNVDLTADPQRHVDLSWQQFPPSSQKLEFKVLDREKLGDSPPTTLRCQMLLSRVLAELR